MKHFISVVSIIVSLVLLVSSCEKEPFLILSSSRSISFPEQGGTQNISFTANRDWSVSSTESWVKVSPSSGAVSEGTITVSLSCDKNTSFDARNATVTIKVEGLSETITVSQESNYGIIVTPTTFEVSSAAQSIEVEVKKNVNYSVEIDAACKKWVSQSGTKTLSSDKLVFDIAANETYDAREGKIVIKQTDGTFSETIIIKQLQKDEIIVSKTEYELSNEEHQLSIEVKSNVDYTVTPDVDWIQVVSTKALSSSTIKLHININETFDERIGHIEVKQSNGGKSVMLTISQAAAISLSISPESLNISKEAQKQSIDVICNTDFDIVIPEDDRSWIQAKELPGTKVLSNKTVEFAFSENTTYQPRSSQVIFKQKNGSLSCALSISQAQTDIIIPEQEEIVVAAFGGSVLIKFDANVSVSYDFDCDWIAVSDNNNPELGFISLEIAANTQNDREAVISLFGGDAKATVVIKQSKMKDWEYMSSDYGQLSKSLSRVKTDTITSATIYGKIDESDFRALNQLPKLAKLSLANAVCFDNAIPSNAFKDNETLTSIVFPNDIEVIGESAFRNCGNLSLPRLPRSLRTIDRYAFYGDSQMKGQLNLPSELQYIGDYAFSSCTGISGNLSFPDNMESIGSYSFSGCSGLNGKLSFPSQNIIYVGDYAFNACRNFTGDLVLPSNIYLNGGYTFNEAGFTGSVYANAAGWYTFMKCNIGGNLIISDDIEALSHSFRGVDVGGYIYIGKNVVSLEEQTFYVVNCEKFYCAAPVPPVCKSKNSIQLGGRYLGVPKGKKSAYENAENWKEAAVIEEVDFSKLKLKP